MGKIVLGILAFYLIPVWGAYFLVCLSGLSGLDKKDAWNTGLFYIYLMMQFGWFALAAIMFKAMIWGCGCHHC